MKNLKNRLLKSIFYRLHSLKIKLYFSLANDVEIFGTPSIRQPTAFAGKGKIFFGTNVSLGYFPSPYFYSGSIHLEARDSQSSISIGKNTFINNNCSLIADKTSITIGDDVLIGTNVEIVDSDFHNLDPKRRKQRDYECLPVVICNNVFIGSNVTILKGVEIGENSVIGNRAVVINSIPSNVIAAGIPAKVIKNL